MGAEIKRGAMTVYAQSCADGVRRFHIRKGESWLCTLELQDAADLLAALGEIVGTYGYALKMPLKPTPHGFPRDADLGHGQRGQEWAP